MPTVWDFSKNVGHLFSTLCWVRFAVEFFRFSSFQVLAGLTPSGDGSGARLVFVETSFNIALVSIGGGASEAGSVELRCAGLLVGLHRKLFGRRLTPMNADGAGIFIASS
jgi:hypothetical protein